MADTGDINVGSIIRFNGELVQITDYQHRTPGNLRAFYQAKMRNLKNGKQNYEQVHIPLIMFGASGKFLKEGMEVKVSFEADEAILAEAPTFIEAQITYTEPGIKGDTATNTLKSATLDTGTEIKVPLFFNEGDWVKIDTRTGEYVERIKK
jgi:elongation factor P